MKENQDDIMSPIERCFLEHIYKTYGLCINVYNQNLKKECQVGRFEDGSLFLATEKFLIEVLNQARNKSHPFFIIENDIFLFGIMLDLHGYLYICGPAVLGTPSVSQIYEFKSKYDIGLKGIKLPRKTYLDIVNMISLLYIYFNQEEIEIDNILELSEVNSEAHTLSQKEILNYRYDQSMNVVERFGYQVEQDHFEAIRDGKVEAFLDYSKIDPEALEKVGDFAMSNSKKLEYMFVTSITLARRAAVEGGMNYMEAYTLSDMYLQKLEQCHKNEEIISLLSNVHLDFASRVRELKSRKTDSYIEFCKNYIIQKIHTPFEISEMADRLGLSVAYLSRKFSEQEGITLTQYRLRERIKASYNFLKYSDYSISEIAEYFCFNSSSHFARYFKEEMGMTPKEYRAKYQVIEFVKNK